jgi:hypothetical protein
MARPFRGVPFAAWLALAGAISQRSETPRAQAQDRASQVVLRRELPIGRLGSASDALTNLEFVKLCEGALDRTFAFPTSAAAWYQQKFHLGKCELQRGDLEAILHERLGTGGMALDDDAVPPGSSARVVLLSSAEGKKLASRARRAEASEIETLALQPARMFDVVIPTNRIWTTQQMRALDGMTRSGVGSAEEFASGGIRVIGLGDSVAMIAKVISAMDTLAAENPPVPDELDRLRSRYFELDLRVRKLEAK